MCGSMDSPSQMPGNSSGRSKSRSGARHGARSAVCFGILFSSLPRHRLDLRHTPRRATWPSAGLAVSLFFKSLLP